MERDTLLLIVTGLSLGNLSSRKKKKNRKKICFFQEHWSEKRSSNSFSESFAETLFQSQLHRQG